MTRKSDCNILQSSTKVCAKNIKNPNKLAITLKDIAEKTNCSVSTVSRVLNNKSKQYRIAEETEKLILETAHNLNYRPNELARGLRLKRSHTIGLVVPDISNPFFAYVSHLIQRHAYEAGYSLILCNTDEDIDLEIEQIELLKRKGVDGYIILPVGTKKDHIYELLTLNKPFVLLDRIFDDIKTNAVVVDNYKGAYQAVKHLIDNGHTRIAIIQGLQNTSTNNARVSGYINALKDHQIPLDEKLIVGNDFRKENGYIETKLLLRLEEPPTAIFTTSDLITLGTLQAISEENKTIPKDVSLVAFDEIDYAPFLVAPLTSVRQPRDLMGQVAVKLLIDDIKSRGTNKKERLVLDPKLILRKSVYNLRSNESEFSAVYSGY